MSSEKFYHNKDGKFKKGHSRPQSQEQKDKKSKRMKELWGNKEYRDKNIKYILNAANKQKGKEPWNKGKKYPKSHLKNPDTGHPYNWKGGKSKASGYVRIWMPEHPYADKSGRVLEHRLVIEKKIGRFLSSDEIIHHINGVKDDNRESNLMIVKRKSHFGKVKCPYCNACFLIK